MGHHDTLPDGAAGTDAELVRTVRAGDDAAFERFFDRYHASVYRAALSLLHDPMAADEAVSDVFLRAYAARDRLDPGRPPGPWLHRIAVNVAISRLRHRRRETSWEHLLGDTEPADMRRSDVERREIAIALARCLGDLAADIRTVVVFRYVLGLTIREISAATGVPPSTVRGRIRAGLEQLRLRLETDTIDRPGATAGPLAAAHEPVVAALEARAR